ncbi:MAG: hypothetical protein QOE73_906 [Verrucomicrobiota bacterium]
MFACCAYGQSRRPRQVPGTLNHPVNLLVVVSGVVMKECELTNASVDGQGNAVRQTAVTPTTVKLKFRFRVLRIEDQKIDLAHKFNQRIISALVFERFVIGKISERTAVGFNAKSGAATGVIQSRDPYSKWTQRDIIGGELLDCGQAKQSIEIYRKIDRIHLIAQRPSQSRAGTSRR